MSVPLTRRGPSRDLLVRDLVALSCELLDAHVDTIELACARELNLRWEAHLEYLRGLQRVGQALLARVGSGEPQ